MERVGESAIFQAVPEYLFDANYYYYENFRNYLYIWHNKHKFEYYIPVGSIAQGSYYVASFAEHLLVTRVGLRATISRRIEDSVSFRIAILAGTNPFDQQQHSTVDEYLKIPPPVSRYEPQYVKEFKISERFDTGKTVRHRVHPGHQLELFLTTRSTATFADTEVFVRVHSSDALGGPYDHPSWTTGYHGSYMKSYDKYEKYVLPHIPRYHTT